MFGWLTKWLPRRELTLQITQSIESTGYDRMTEIDERVAKLSELLAAACTRWESKPDGTTYCNFFCQEIARGFGITELDLSGGAPLMAADMGPKIQRLIQDAQLDGTPCKWREDVAQRAVEHAKKGGFVLAWAGAPVGEKHGHVAVLAPEDMEMSGTFGYPVPRCASIARNPFHNRIGRVSEFFKASNKPVYFLYDPENDA